MVNNLSQIHLWWSYITYIFQRRYVKSYPSYIP